MTRSVAKAVACVLVSVPAVLFSVGVASAEPPPPPLPAPSPPPALPLFPLAQAGAPVSTGGLPAPLDLSGRISSEYLLGQHALPSAPGSGAPATAPDLNPWNNRYLLPQNLIPSAPGQGQIFGVAPGQENAIVSSIDYLKRLVETYRAGGLEGALLGQNPVEGLGKPLPPQPPQQ
jgi:hypothetical protein